MAGGGPHTIEEFLHTAQVRGQRAVARARIVASAAFLAMQLPVRVAAKCGAEVADIVVGMRWAAGLQVFDHGGRPLPLNPNPARVLDISFGGKAARNGAYHDVGGRLGRAVAKVPPGEKRFTGMASHRRRLHAAPPAHLRSDR